MPTQFAQFVSRINRRTLFLALLVLATGGISFLALVLPFSGPVNGETLRVGSVAPREYLAPYALTYESKVLTQEKQDRQAAAVAPVYTTADTSIARKQLERLNAALGFISTVRNDTLSTQDQKLADLSQLEGIQLNSDTAVALLGLSEERWLIVRQEANDVLEQVMRTTIREDRLDDARRGVPALISLSLPEDQASIVAELVTAFVAPNSLYNASQTEIARQQARNSVAPVMSSFVTGETIVQRGQVLTASDLEALAQFGFQQAEFRWQDLAGAAFMVILAMAFLAIYLLRNRALLAGPQELRSLILVAILFLFYLSTARLLIPGHTVVPYLFPLASYSLLVSTLFGVELALISSLPLAIMISFGLPYALELTLYFLLTSFFSVLTLGSGRRITSYFWTALVIAGAGVAVVLAYRLPQANTDWLGIATLALAALANAVASASITLILQFFLAQVLGKTTALQLLELSRPDHPLLQQLLRTAPGTYQHSLQVANLAEQAAEQIGADALLTRVGALYHDIGKSVNSIFFIENQVPGNLNPHDDLDPALSAAMIIRHIEEGLNLAQRYRLPRRIQDFIAEHHGDLITRYQYCRALEIAGGEAEKVNESLFRYPGPRPQSRETALLMLADGCEARVRADHPKDEAELRKMIKSFIAHRVGEGALNDTDLTLHDLEKIENSFTATLRGIYHPRIQYPSLETLPAGVAALPEPARLEPAKPVAGQDSILSNEQPAEPAGQDDILSYDTSAAGGGSEVEEILGAVELEPEPGIAEDVLAEPVAADPPEESRPVEPEISVPMSGSAVVIDPVSPTASKPGSTEPTTPLKEKPAPA